VSTLCAIADWVAALNPFAFACLVIAFAWVIWMLAAACWYFVLAARSGAGEANPEEVESETHQPDAVCVRSACAWCEPGTARGICPEHAADMRRQSEEAQS
jgi:hypothetical protein